MRIFLVALLFVAAVTASNVRIADEAVLNDIDDMLAPTGSSSETPSSSSNDASKASSAAAAAPAATAAPVVAPTAPSVAPTVAKPVAPTAAPAAPAATSAASAFPSCADIITEINSLRTNPAAYAQKLQQYNSAGSWSAHSSCVDTDNPKCMFTRSDGVMFLTHEGITGISNAIAFLQIAKPVSQVTVSAGLCSAANDLVSTQGPAGEIGHVGPRGSSVLTRVKTFGNFNSGVSEIVQYGSFLGDGTVFDIVAQLIVGDGDVNKLHRLDLLRPDWNTAGASMGTHLTYSLMSCIVLADGFTAHSQ